MTNEQDFVRSSLDAILPRFLDDRNVVGRAARGDLMSEGQMYVAVRELAAMIGVPRHELGHYRTAIVAEIERRKK